jgi:aldose sugar dehydrogenase
MEAGMQFILLLAALLVPTRTALMAPQTLPSSTGNLKVETVAGGLLHPWSLVFLPDGRMLVTERPGRMGISTGRH